ncbi:hypothetical protein LZC95_19480 [Pendulispora brunnea]|uniref:Helix-turn-helix domain-containing protein n=1 Tax=Pendulispora brunnea TaxID=2905690 RepID=A0ABZ2KLQ9_9BACT
MSRRRKIADDSGGERILLSKLDPRQVAIDVCQKVIDHRLHQELQFLEEVGIRPLPRAEVLAATSNPGRTAQWLTLAARRGLPIGDWTHTGIVADGMTTIFDLLYTSPGNPNGGGRILDMPDDVNPSDAIGVVLLACKCRIAVDQRHDVTPRELAAVSGCAIRTVQRDIAEGHLRPKKGTRPQRIPWREALRWLIKRDVPGFRVGDDFESPLRRSVGGLRRSTEAS